jgi:hypothetical protein
VCENRARLCLQPIHHVVWDMLRRGRHSPALRMVLAAGGSWGHYWCRASAVGGMMSQELWVVKGAVGQVVGRQPWQAYAMC